MRHVLGALRSGVHTSTRHHSRPSLPCLVCILQGQCYLYSGSKDSHIIAWLIHEGGINSVASTAGLRGAHSGAIIALKSVPGARKMLISCGKDLPTKVRLHSYCVTLTLTHQGAATLTLTLT